MKGIIAIIVVMVLVIAGALYFGVTETWEDGAPPAQITVKLTEPSTGNEWEGEINVNEGTIGTITGQRTTLQPAEITAQLIGVDPTVDYELEFTIVYQASLPAEAPPETILYGDISVIGTVDFPPGTQRYFYSPYPDHIRPLIEDQQLNPPEYEGIAEFVKPEGLHWDKTFVDPDIQSLKGAHLDGSSWVCTIETSTAFAGTEAFYGRTIVMITLALDTEGNINIVVTDVDVTGSEV